jgi:2-polyprenyl-3-methyl-5-hydroxy-6-metoxy-1,4-benzoquinol methylase
MPDVASNRKVWNEWQWSPDAEDWSIGCGNSETQWFFSIFPRIHAFLPTSTILEIAPGGGRWTKFLKNYCDQLIAVDIAETCIELCRKRFAGEHHLTFYLNDGKSLDMIAPNSIDFVFSLDSLVHADADVIQAYLQQIAKKLSPNGIGFVHHSNLGQYPRLLRVLGRLPYKVLNVLTEKSMIGPLQWRSWDTSADVVERSCREAGLQCISQECVTWGGKILLDCFSTFVRKESSMARPNRRFKNQAFHPSFFNERLQQLSLLYSDLANKSHQGHQRTKIIYHEEKSGLWKKYDLRGSYWSQ